MLLLPQRYVFSSKSQHFQKFNSILASCYCYHKGTYFQANHNCQFNTINGCRLLLLPQRYVFSSKSQHSDESFNLCKGCYCYHKGTYFQANHNLDSLLVLAVVLLLLPQRYVFSSKSQQPVTDGSANGSCYCYHKGTYFQANHNITLDILCSIELLLLPQRYVFSSKSQLITGLADDTCGCYCYHKGTYFQANHNQL